ncbi:MAG TPA: hypothetical protein VFG15_31725 [Amycolatopsis sp.]|nr:hypothetical protein [Amycolatopsis sp.]
MAGAVLLALGTLEVLLVIAEPAIRSTPWPAGGLLAGSAAVLAVWAFIELRTAVPLVNLRLLGQGPLLRANVAILVAGAGLYLLFSPFTRYVQTPDGAHYGFALPGGAAAGALLFAGGNRSLVLVLLAIALLGFAVGGLFAVMPKLVLVGVPPAETASVLSVNQIARSIGMAAGSALAGLLLAATTPDGALLPTQNGYLTTALWALPHWLSAR